MSTPRTRAPTGGRRARFLRATGGSAAVEFAMLVAPFLALVVGIVAIGLDFYIFAQLDRATQAAVQEIRSGAVQARKLTRADFRDTIFCPKLALLSCDTTLINALVMRTYTDWGNLPPTSVNPSLSKWCTGNPRDIVMVQVAYPVPMAAMVWAGNAFGPDGRRYYLVYAGFRNEPFGVPNPPGPGCT